MSEKINKFKFLTDENIQSEVVVFLRNNNFDVLDVKELNFNGKSDNFLFDYALDNHRVIITHDSDFGRLLFNHSNSLIGIIYLRPGHFNPEISINSLKILFSQNIEIKHPFIVTVENNSQKVKIRIREL